MGKAGENQEIAKYMRTIKNHKGLIIKITLSLTFLVLIFLIISPKYYESTSVIQSGKIGDLEYSSLESKITIESPEVLNSIIEEYHEDLDLKEYKEDYLNIELIKNSNGFQVEETPYIRITTLEKNPEIAQTINSKIIEKFFSQVSSNYQSNLNILNNELKNINQNIKTLESEILDLENDISKSSKGSLSDQTITKTIILKTLLSEKRIDLKEENMQKKDLENTLASKREFRIISPPDLSKNPVGPAKPLVLIITLIISFAISILYVSIKDAL